MAFKLDITRLTDQKKSAFKLDTSRLPDQSKTVTNNDTAVATIRETTPEEAERQNEALLYSLSFDISPTQALGQLENLRKVIEQDTEAQRNVQWTRDVLEDIQGTGRILGKSLFYAEHSVEGSNKKEDIIATAESFHSKGLIRDDELQAVKDNPTQLPAWATVKPEMFYKKDAIEQIEDLVRGTAAGIQGVTAGHFHGMSWLSGENAVGKAARSAGQWLDELTEFTRPKRPAFVADLGSGFGSMVFFAATGGVVGTAAKVVGI
ncbi:hypothetical protein LCGC14_2253460, partial [marine sediment metagenome]